MHGRDGHATIMRIMPVNTNWKSLHGDRFAGAPCLITGGAGFIGSHIAEALAQLGAQIVVLDDLSDGARENLAHLSNVDFHEGSILDRAVVERAVRGCRWVFHEAALGSVPRSVEQPALYNDVNTTGTLNVLEAARHANVQRV